MTRISLRWPAAALCLAALALVPGCKFLRKTPLRSTVNTRDPRVAGQLLEGFYGVEAGAWRWTAKQFSVKLKTPPGAAQKGATLRIFFTVPPVVIERSATVTLAGSMNGLALAPEPYSAPGPYVFQRDIPVNVLNAPDVTASFWLDKSMIPGGLDKRELGLVVATISLDAK